MQHIPLLVVCITIGGSTLGCATTSLEELTAEAMECVDQSTNLAGVIGASKEQRTACWADANEKIESMAKAEKMREERKGASCGPRLIAWCDWKGGVCISSRQMDDIFRRAGMR